MPVGFAPAPEAQHFGALRRLDGIGWTQARPVGARLLMVPSQTNTGTASGVFGGLTGTATGTRTTFGTAVATFGGLTGVATGARQISGTAVGVFGALTGTASGSVTVAPAGYVCMTVEAPYLTLTVSEDC